jgi:hypothetical protein
VLDVNTLVALAWTPTFTALRLSGRFQHDVADRTVIF